MFILCKCCSSIIRAGVRKQLWEAAEYMMRYVDECIMLAAHQLPQMTDDWLFNNNPRETDMFPKGIASGKHTEVRSRQFA